MKVRGKRCNCHVDGPSAIDKTSVGNMWKERQAAGFGREGRQGLEGAGVGDAP
jgi:hypothetical protein